MDSNEIFSNSLDDDANEEHAQNISIKSMQENVSTLEKQVNQLKIQVHNLKTQNNELEDGLTDYRQQLLNKDVQYKEIVQKLNAKQNVIDQLESELFKEVREREASSAANKEKEREIITLKHDIKGLTNLNTELEEKVFYLQEQLDSISSKKLTFENDFKNLLSLNQEYETSLKTTILEKELIQIQMSELQIVCDQQVVHIDNLRTPLNLSVESDGAMSHRTLYMSAYDMEDSPGHNAASIFEEQLKETQDILKQTTDEKSAAIEELAKTKQANCVLSKIIDELKKEIDTALPASPRPSSSRTAVKEVAGNISASDTDTSETDLTMYQAWLESVRSNVVKHNLAITAATRDRATLEEQLREKVGATRLLLKQLSDLENDKNEVETSLKMLEDKLASANARFINLEAKNKDLREELESRYTLSHVKKIEQLYKDKHEEKIKKLVEYHNKDKMKIDSLREINQQLETKHAGQIKQNRQRISQLEADNNELQERLREKDKDIAFLLKKLKTSNVNKMVFSPQAERQVNDNFSEQPKRSASSPDRGGTLSTDDHDGTRRQVSFPLGARPKTQRNFSPFKVDPRRLAELQYRNTKQPPHLKSTYAAETNFNGEKYSEKDLKFGYRVSTPDSKSLPTTANTEVTQTLDLAQDLSPIPVHNQDSAMVSSTPNRPLTWLSRTLMPRRDGDSSSVTPLRARFNLQD